MKELSDCCKAEAIPPDEETAEQAGSLCSAFLCYIRKECGKPCKVLEAETELKARLGL